MRKYRYRIAAVIGALALALSALLAGGGTPANAASYTTISVAYNSHWCITGNGNGQYAQFVLGQCAAGAFQQEFRAVLYSAANQTYQLQDETGWCITYNIVNGAPDGAAALQGYCVGAQNQLFTRAYESAGGNAWIMPYRKDAGGHNYALNNANGVLAVYNPINGSWYGSGNSSEAWYGPVLA